jgi:hypothetical protein
MILIELVDMKLANPSKFVQAGDPQFKIQLTQIVNCGTAVQQWLPFLLDADNRMSSREVKSLRAQQQEVDETCSWD